MANERTTRGPLTATVGERLGEKAREGDTAGVERAQAVVADLQGGGAPPQGEAHAAGARPPAHPRQGSRGRARGSGLGWALAAGLGAVVVVGIVRRAFGR